MILPNVTHHFTFEHDQWGDFPGDIQSLCNIFEARLAHRFGDECRVRAEVSKGWVLRVSVTGPFGLLTTAIEADLLDLLATLTTLPSPP